jgi:hypothetical protein
MITINGKASNFIKPAKNPWQSQVYSILEAFAEFWVVNFMLANLLAYVYGEQELVGVLIKVTGA